MVGTRSRLACVATCRCWHSSKVIHCIGGQTLLRESMNMQDSFSVLPCSSILPALFLLLLLFVFTLWSRLPQLFTLHLRSSAHSSRRSLYIFTLHLRSPNSLFPLLVFASHTLARVTLPVTCTVNWVGLNLTAVTKLSSYDLLIFKDLLWMFFVASAGIVIFLPTGSPQRRKSLWRG